jgi:hypothetical protein
VPQQTGVALGSFVRSLFGGARVGLGDFDLL